MLDFCVTQTTENETKLANSVPHIREYIYVGIIPCHPIFCIKNGTEEFVYLWNRPEKRGIVANSACNRSRVVVVIIYWGGSGSGEEEIYGKGL